MTADRSHVRTEDPAGSCHRTSPTGESKSGPPHSGDTAKTPHLHSNAVAELVGAAFEQEGVSSLT